MSPLSLMSSIILGLMLSLVHVFELTALLTNVGTVLAFSFESPGEPRHAGATQEKWSGTCGKAGRILKAAFFPSHFLVEHHSLHWGAGNACLISELKPTHATLEDSFSACRTHYSHYTHRSNACFLGFPDSVKVAFSMLRSPIPSFSR